MPGALTSRKILLELAHKLSDDGGTISQEIEQVKVYTVPIVIRIAVLCMLTSVMRK